MPKAIDWQPTIQVRALASHRLEAAAVADYGDKLDERFARALFPEFDGLEYAA